MDGKVLQRLKKKKEEASDVKDSDDIKFKEGCAAIGKEAPEQGFLPGALGGPPTARPPAQVEAVFI